MYSNAVSDVDEHRTRSIAASSGNDHSMTVSTFRREAVPMPTVSSTATSLLLGISGFASISSPSRAENPEFAFVARVADEDE